MATVGPKGQIVIDKKLREKLGVEPGWTAIQFLVDDHIEVYFVPGPHNRSLYGSLAPHTDVRLGDKPWHEIKEETWQAVAEERFRRMAESEEEYLSSEEASGE